jgi:hypothetical protein
MNKTEKTAFRESVIVVMMGMIINFPPANLFCSGSPLIVGVGLTHY